MSEIPLEASFLFIYLFGGKLRQGRNPFKEGDENSTADSPSEIHFHNIREHTVEINKKIQIADKDILSSRMYFNSSLNLFIFVSDKEGVLVISLDGEVVFKDEHFKGAEYNVETGYFFAVDNLTISVYELTE